MVSNKPLHPEVREWARAVAARGSHSDHWVNLCFLHNLLVREFRHHNFHRNNIHILQELLKRVSQLYSSRKPLRPLEARKLVDEVIRESEQTGSPLYSEAKKVRRNSAKLSRVLTVGDLIYNNLPPMLRKRYVRRGLGLHRFIDELENNERMRNRIIQGLEGPIRGKFKCAFVTKTHELNGSKVDEALSMLGFADVGNEHWVELRYPREFSSRWLLKAATVLSAGDNPIFRSEKPNSPGWGRAINVETLAPGLSEAVHDEYSIRKGESFIPHYMGQSTKREFNQWKSLFIYNKVNKY